MNLQAIVKAKGARTTLWDQEQPCPRAGCGQVVFQAATNDTAQMWDLIWDRRGSWQAPMEAVRD